METLAFTVMLFGHVERSLITGGPGTWWPWYVVAMVRGHLSLVGMGAAG